MAAKPQQTLGDYVTIALSPLLIMALVGSLVFFLLEILYAGQYEGRLQWTLFFFVFGIVLIARISIEQGNERATFFGLALGTVVFIALQTFVLYPPDTLGASFGWAINLGLMALSWWCAHRLTWDCTYIDDTVDATGKGVLEAAGLDEQAGDGGSKSEDSETTAEQSDPRTPSFLSWLDRYRRYRQEQLRKPHTPGVWVVYFSLAALPLFGLGQSLIPTSATDRRHYAFWLMVCYVGSGLGLLLTTSYLGLRRYLRQRKLRMPLPMTRMWLVLGGSLVVLMLVVGALMPRPYAEYQIVNLTQAGSKDLKSAKYALKKDSAGKGKGDPSSDPTRSDKTAEDGQGKQRDDKSVQTQGDGKSPGNQQGKSGASGKQKGNQQGNNKDQQSDNQDSQKSQSESGKKDDQQGDQDKGDQSKDENAQQRNSEDKGKDDKQKSKASNPAADKDPRKDQSSQNTGRSKSQDSSNSPSFSSVLKSLATLLKWIVFGILALAFLFFLLRSGLKFLANFTTWAQRLLAALDAWWKNLFGRKETVADPVTGEAKQVRKRPRPFSSFSNPFRDGTAAHFSPDELATYSFDALQSWAWEHGLARGPEETPLEFAERFTSEVPALETEVRGLAGMYARVAYARGRLTSNCLTLLSQFWQRLEAVDDRPLSA